MPILAALTAVIVILTIIHVAKTGRPQWWIYIVLFAPVVGSLAYLLFEVIPNTRGAVRAQRTVDQALKGVSRALAPDAELAKRIAEVEACGSIDNKIKLAQECLATGHADEARELVKQCLAGTYGNDPNLKYMLLQADYGAGDHTAAKANAECLLRDHPGYRTGDVKLALARIAEWAGELNAAEGYYSEIVDSYPGEAARFHYGVMLKRLGRTDRARELFEKILANAKRATEVYRDQEGTWIKAARRELTM